MGKVTLVCSVFLVFVGVFYLAKEMRHGHDGPEFPLGRDGVSGERAHAETMESAPPYSALNEAAAVPDSLDADRRAVSPD